MLLTAYYFSHYVASFNQYFNFWILTNLNMVFPVIYVVLVFDFNESSEGVLRGHWSFQKRNNNNNNNNKLYL
jgi:hypothetical protein